MCDGMSRHNGASTCIILCIHSTVYTSVHIHVNVQLCILRRLVSIVH